MATTETHTSGRAVIVVDGKGESPKEVGETTITEKPETGVTDKVTDKVVPALMARLSRWLERDPAPEHEELLTLFTARLTDMAANKLAKQWSARYLASDAKERRALLTAIAQASSSLEPR